MIKENPLTIINADVKLIQWTTNIECFVVSKEFNLIEKQIIIAVIKRR